MRQICVYSLSLLLSIGLLAGAVEAQDYQWVKGYSAGAYVLDVPPGSSNVYTGGNFLGTVDFNPGSGTANLTAVGGPFDGYVAKYSASGGYQWAKRFGGTGYEWVSGIETDSSGNVFAVGHFSGTADFDPGSGTANLTASGIYDGFMLKLNSSGSYQWAKRIGGTGVTSIKGIQRDSAGNLFVVGLFNGTTDFNPGSGTTNLTASNQEDAYFAKYNSSGNLVWVKHINGSGQLLDPGLALDSSNNVYVSGTFSGSVNVIGATLSGTASRNLFVVKYNSSGSRLWSKVITGGNGSTAGRNEPIAVDSSNNVYRIGHFNGSISFAGQTVSSAGNNDVFLAKYNSSGSEQWIRRMGGSQDETGDAVTVDAAGDVYISGTYWGNGDWDPGSGTHTLTHKGYSDIYFGKYTSGGNLIWAHGVGSPGSGPLAGRDDSHDITVDGSGNVYINGLLGGTTDFDVSSGTANYNAAGYFAKYSQASSSGCVTPPSNMRAWYSFDSTSTVQDLAGSNNGVRVGPVATTGKVAGAYDFDGSNDYVYVNDNSALDFGSGDFSIDAWIKTTDTHGTIVSKRQYTGGKYVGYLLMVYNSRLLLQIGDSTNSWSNYYSSSMPTVNNGQWRLVAVTVDRNSSTGGKIYIDGNLVYTFNPTNRSGNISNAARLEIGRTTGGPDYFDGAIDEVELFNRSLTAGEISSLWAAGANGKCKTGVGNPDPLNVNLQCLSTTQGDYHSCFATATGGSGGNSFTWSYTGDGLMAPSGSSADVYINNCTGGLNVISVTVTDSASASDSASRFLSCSSCGSFICED